MIDWLTAWWGWFIVGFALLLLELSLPCGVFVVFFVVGAICVVSLEWWACGQEAWVQLTFSSIFSIVTSILFRRRLLVRFGPKAGDVSVDSLVGEAATVIDNIEAGGFGKVELRGTAWNAKNSGDRILVRGERCKVQRVDGLSLWDNKEGS